MSDFGQSVIKQNKNIISMDIYVERNNVMLKCHTVKIHIVKLVVYVVVVWIVRPAAIESK